MGQKNINNINSKKTKTKNKRYVDYKKLNSEIDCLTVQINRLDLLQ